MQMASRGQASGGRPWHGGAVLLVEDDPAHAALLREVLGRTAGTVEQVTSGAEAVAALARRRFDLVVLDLGLPDVSGLTVLEEMRARGDTTPVAVVSIDDAAEKQGEARRLGAAHYVVKRPGYLAVVAAAAGALLAAPGKAP